MSFLKCRLKHRWFENASQVLAVELFSPPCFVSWLRYFSQQFTKNNHDGSVNDYILGVFSRKKIFLELTSTSSEMNNSQVALDTVDIRWAVNSSTSWGWILTILLETKEERQLHNVSVFGNRLNQTLSLYVTRDGIIMSQRWSDRQMIETEGNWSPMLSGLKVNAWKLLTNY